MKTNMKEEIMSNKISIQRYPKVLEENNGEMDENEALRKKEG